MDAIKQFGKKSGELVGLALGGTVRVIGEVVNSPYVKEIGDDVERVTASTGKLLGGTISGMWEVGAGIVQQDRDRLGEGVSEIESAASSVFHGLVEGVDYVVRNGSELVHGIREGDRGKMNRGIRNLGKVVLVGTVAVTVFDVLDGADTARASSVAELSDTGGHSSYASSSHLFSGNNSSVDIREIETRNAGLEGTVHGETGVPFERKVIELPNGDVVSGVFPDFDEVYAGELPQSIYLESDSVQFSYMNEQLARDVMSDPKLASQFTPEQLAQIEQRETPDGYVWNHSEEPGRMELVDEQTHAQTGHTGGRSLWGGGAAYR